MKIAVAYDNGEIFQHFGHTEIFKIYDVEDNKIIGISAANAAGSGHGALAGFLKSLSVDTLICGGIGAGAKDALAAAGIKLFGGASGSADEAVNALLAGRLSYDPDIKCGSHGHGHSGGGHKCGEHSCTAD